MIDMYPVITLCVSTRFKDENRYQYTGADGLCCRCDKAAGATTA